MGISVSVQPVLYQVTYQKDYLNLSHFPVFIWMQFLTILLYLLKEFILFTLITYLAPLQEIFMAV